MKSTGLKKWFIFLVAVLLVVLALFYFGKQTVSEKPFVHPTPTPTPVAASSGNVLVSSPHPNERVSQDFQVTGKARVFENVVSMRVKNKLTDKVYVEDHMMTNAPDAGQFGDFTFTVHLQADPSLKSGNTLILEVYQVSPKDGSDIDKVTIPLIFSPLL